MFLYRSTEVINKFGSLNIPCGIRCSQLWDGNGRWVNETWKPYLSGELLVLLMYVCTVGADLERAE